MRPPDEVRLDLVRQWVAKAEEDFRVASLLIRRKQAFHASIAFHAQQAAEKHLKALLINFGIGFPKTHNISALLDLLKTSRARLALELRSAEFLTPFGVSIRYPGDEPTITRMEARRALRVAGRVRSRLTRLLASALPPRSRRRRRSSASRSGG